MRRDPEIERTRNLASRLERMKHELQRQNIELERAGLGGRPEAPIEIHPELEGAFDRALGSESAAFVVPERQTPGLGWVRG